MRTLLLPLTTPWLVMPLEAKYSGGSGTAQDPYQIATAADLIALGETPADYDKHFILTADIDLDPNLPGRKVFDRAVIAPDTDRNDKYYAFQGTPFTGTFDGGGHTISHLTIAGRDYLGLFGHLGQWNAVGEIRDLGVVDVNIMGSGSFVGGLVGANAGTVINCYSTGSVSGTGQYVGGLAGKNNPWSIGPTGILTQCYSTCAVSGSNIVGGLAGYNFGSVTNCHSTGVVSGTSMVGGLIGFVAQHVSGGCGTVVDSHSTGAVKGTGNCVGGLVGRNCGEVGRCYSTGVVSADGNDVGGLVGTNEFEYGAVTQCYCTGTVVGSNSVGGLVGSNWNPVVRCYSTGAVQGKDNVGGLVGHMGTEDEGGSVIECYSVGRVSGTGNCVGGLTGGERLWRAAASFWDIQTSGQTTSADGSGKTTAEMQDPKTFIAAGWDFVGESDGPDDLWALPAGGGYPVLYWQLPDKVGLPRFSGGTGEPNDPYRISTAQDLNSIGSNPRLMKCHFKMLADLDLTGLLFYPIGNYDHPYGGVFDGNGHAVSHLTVKEDGNWLVGLFRALDSGGEVKDLGIAGANVTGSGTSGGLVGSNWGSVTQCYSTGMVSGTRVVGGLVGGNSGTVTQCYSTAAVASTGSNVGGLVGYNSGGSVTQCYSIGSVRGIKNVGGLVGLNSGLILDSYAYGSVSGTSNIGGLVGGDNWLGTVTGCFWDTQTSGQATSARGTGKTTAQMQTSKTFLDAVWDFVGETANGTEDIWWILEGKDYPRLWWELPPAK